jgi:hypothetical protein
MCFCFLGYTSKIPQKYYGCLDFTSKLFVILICFDKSNCIEEKKMYKSTRGHTLKSIKACYLGHIDQRQPENEPKAKGKYRLPRQTVG